MFGKFKVGINPGRESSLRGHPYAHKSNLFWPLLRDSGLVGPHITCDDHRTLIHPPLRYGFTNVVSRPSRSADVLTSQEYQQGVVKLKEKLSRLNPPPYLICFVGMEIFRIFTGNKNVRHMNASNALVEMTTKLTH
jgi:TDG/mug DNA glycosylase family protein